MSNGIEIFNTLSPGDATSEGLDGKRVEVFGCIFHVNGFIGDRDKAILITSAEKSTNTSPVDLLDQLVHGVANLAIISADWSKTDPGQLLTTLQRHLYHHFQAVYLQHMEALAARGKPS